MIKPLRTSEEKIGIWQSEIEKLTLLSNRMKEALQDPLINDIRRHKYNAAIKEYEKKIKIMKSDIKAAQLLENMDIDQIEIPRHYQHHSK